MKKRGKEIILFLKKTDSRKLFLAVGVILLLAVIGGFWIVRHADKRGIYEVAVMVRDQYNANPTEDQRSSLKIGDVLVVKPGGQQWSQIEKVSYLILKMRLTEKEAQELTQPETKKMNKPAPTDTELKDLPANEQKDLIASRKEQEEQIIRPRAYRIKMSKFKNFQAIDLLNVGQPFEGKVYDWGVVEEK